MGRLFSSRWVSIVAISHSVKLDCFFCRPVQLAGLVLPQVGELGLGCKKLVSGRGAGLLLEGWGAGWEGRGGREVSGTSLDWRRTSTDWEGPGEGEGWILNGNYLTTRGRENLQILSLNISPNQFLKM